MSRPAKHWKPLLDGCACIHVCLVSPLWMDIRLEFSFLLLLIIAEEILVYVTAHMW